MCLNSVPHVSPLTLALLRHGFLLPVNVFLFIYCRYEEYPYPRWEFLGDCVRGTNVCASPQSSPSNQTASSASFRDTSNPPLHRILVAGAGTGRFGLQLAVQQPSGTEVTLLDQSAASLAYAKRMAERLSVGDNVKVMQRDLLSLQPNQDGLFDLIVSNGVLHHLEVPEEGLSALVRVLKPNGAFPVCVISGLS